MESPVVVDKPPEYHGNAAKNNERGFPFDEEEASGAWSELAARHPDIAARLRQRPATWHRKRRPSSQDADDFGDGFGGFDRFPFDDIPPEFREHFPSHWNRSFSARDPPQPQTQATPQQQTPQQQTTSTQTEQDPVVPPEQDQQTPLPQYGLRNTVDLGQKSPADPSLVDAEDRNQRSMSAPPDSRAAKQNFTNKMSGQQNHQEQQHQPQQAEHQSSNVRHIPIFVEGRDEPVINKSVDHGTHFGESKPAYVPPPQQPHIDREQYFADDGPTFHHPPNFSRTFGTPFNKGFRQGPQPFAQQKVYPQSAFARGASPQRSQSPKPQMHPEEHFVKVPVHHEQPAPRAEPPSRPQQKQPQQQHQPPPQQQHHQQQQPKSPQEPQSPPQQPKQQPSANDPITQILSIQTDVLNLMTDVENFTGSKKDKRYLYLDEMLTRNLIKLDNIETDGKENIRQARKEAIRCIQKCIAVLEAKAEKGSAALQPQAEPQTQSQLQDVEMKENMENEKQEEKNEATENGEVEMKEATKEEAKVEAQAEPNALPQEEKKEEQKPQQEEKKDGEKPKEEEKKEGEQPQENKEEAQPEAVDTRPEENKVPEQKTEIKQEEQKKEEIVEKKPTTKKGTKTVKKRDKSKDKKEVPKDSNKDEKVEEKKGEKKIEDMQVDEKGDKTNSQEMEVDGVQLVKKNSLH